MYEGINGFKASSIAVELLHMHVFLSFNSVRCGLVQVDKTAMGLVNAYAQASNNHTDHFFYVDGYARAAHL